MTTRAKEIRELGNTGYLEVDSSGNVGIGKTSPNTVTNYKTLHIDGTVGSLLDMGASNLESRIVADTNGLGFQVTPGSHAHQNIRWKAGQISGAVDSHMILLADGNVGIGTTSPSSNLEVAGGDLAVSAGHIGIGLSTPSQYGSGVPTLHFQGTSSANTRAGAIYFTENTGDQTGAIYSTDGSDGYGGIILHSAQGDMKFSTGGLQDYRIVIDTSGNVGIGTAPSAPLDIQTPGNTVDGTYYSTITVNNTGTNTWSRLRFDRNGSARWGISLGTDDKFKISNLNLNNGGTADDGTFVISDNNDITSTGTFRSEKGTIQTVTATPNTQASGNPVNVWSEINSNYRVQITKKYADTRILGTYHIPMNPTGATNILMAIAPWYSTNGGTTKNIISQGIANGSRHNLAVSWFRSNNGFDVNDMQNHVVHFHLDGIGAGVNALFGWYFRSEGGNTTYFCHSQGNNGTWGWVAPMYLELREVDL